ncbi:hypothetical protein V6767_12875 [Martelella sp. FLE1502]
MSEQQKAISRSNRREIRNPVLALPAMRELAELPIDDREAIARLMDDLAKDARQRAQKSWLQNKGPMAAYWKAVGAYAAHIRAALRNPIPPKTPQE